MKIILYTFYLPVGNTGKCLLTALSALLIFSSCQKLDKEESKSGDVVSSNALAPLPCHSTSFVTNYPTNAGSIPPFKFTKTLYADTRVKTINMLSRNVPVYAAYKPQACEIIGTFTYATNTAYFKGTKEIWEYYKTSTGAPAKKSISKKTVSWKFGINPNTGFCEYIFDELYRGEIVAISYDYTNPKMLTNIYLPEHPDRGPSGAILYYATNDKYGNVTTYYFPYNRWVSYPSYTYDYNIPRGSKNYSYVPSQNLICQEFSLLEVMQWLPQSTHQRKTTSGTFYPYPTSTYPFNTGTKIVQSQTYYNQLFDAKGNMTSYTYADRVIQKTTWFCK